MSRTPDGRAWSFRFLKKSLANRTFFSREKKVGKEKRDNKVLRCRTLETLFLKKNLSWKSIARRLPPSGGTKLPLACRAQARRLALRGRSTRRMHRAARSPVSQGDGEGVNLSSRLSRNPPTCQEIARNVPPHVAYKPNSAPNKKKRPLQCNGRRSSKITWQREVCPPGTFCWQRDWRGWYRP